MYQRHSRAFGQVYPFRESRGTEHRDDGHAVHVIGNAFAMIDCKASPTFAFGGLEALEEVEKWEG